MEKNFPGKFWILEIVLAARAILEIKGITLPFMMVILAPPASGKSTVMILIELLPKAYSLDKFTPRAFQSHMAGRSIESLEKNDLLTKIKGKIFLVSDLAPLFSASDDDIRENFGTLTRLLDGKGLKTSSGVHGERSSGPVFFIWIGGAVEVSKNIWSLIAKLGPKMFFLRIRLEMTYDEEQHKIMENMMSKEEYETKIDEVKEKLVEYWDAVTSFPLQEDSKVVWDKSKESPDVVLVIVKHAQLLARLRGYVPTDKTEGTGGSNYGFQEPIIEDPERATRYLYNLVRGFALGQGRNYIIEEDVSIIKQIVMSSAAKERVELLKLLIKNNGEVTVTQLMDARGVTRSTALKTMKLLKILGLVDEIKLPGSTKDISAIRLKDHFRWILENKE
ncbi:MAG: HTH domain-containing protein [Thaumarchaeota archaeon]|nr:HTH domain-containing protein [Nitrososphaerota archaeon]